MTTQTLNLIFSLGNLLLLAAIAVYVYSLKKKESSLSREESRIHKEAAKVLNRAQEKAEALVEEAVIKSKEVLAETEVFKEDIEKNLRSVFEKAVDKNVRKLESQAESLSGDFEKMFKDIRSRYLEQTKDLLDTLQVSGKKGIDEIGTVVKEETLGFQFDLDKKLAEEIAKVSQEVEAYKAEQLKTINESMSKIIAKVSQEVLGKTIPLSDHEDLVIEALEKAKKEGLFNE